MKANRLSCLSLRGVTLSALSASTFTALCALAMSRQPLTADENEFFMAITRWAEWRHTIPHPHLYIHWAQLMVAIFGATVEAVRLSVLIPHLLTLPLLIWLARLLCGNAAVRTDWPRIAVLAVLLYALNPLSVQNSVLIDIDNGMLTMALTALLCLWLALRQRPVSVRIATLSVAFAICLWIKLPTPPMLAVALMVGEAWRRNWREAGIALTCTLLGTALFVASHSVYGALTGYTLSDALAAFAWRAGNESTILSQIPSTLVQTVGVLAFWLGLPFVLLTLPVIWNSARRFVQGRVEDEDIGLLYAAGVLVFYSTMIVPAWGYPRYHTPALPILTLAVSAWAVKQIGQAGREFRAVALAVATAGALYLALFVGDPLYDIYRATFETTALSERLRIGGAAFARTALPVVMVISLSLILTGRLSMTRAGALAGLLAALALGSYLATDLIQVTAPYSTRYRYTYVYADRARATEAVRAGVPLNGYSLTDKDLLWYADRPGEQVYPYLGNPDQLKDILRRRRVDVIAWAEKERLKATALNSDREALTILERCYRSEQFGVFTVLTRTSAEPCLGIR
ncbi:MAG: hypothetical protein RMN25_13935 [Anaerolineae bacterium]|nr:hypothetical protein [Thermoflexales bacterium]MDW8408871.1 hypothetical protein [Anaerolineae bacterium]